MQTAKAQGKMLFDLESNQGNIFAPECAVYKCIPATKLLFFLSIYMPGLGLSTDMLMSQKNHFSVCITIKLDTALMGSNV